MARTLYLLLATSFLLGCTSRTAKDTPADPLFLTIVAGPGKFDGKAVTFNAWITLRQEDRNLWATWRDHEDWQTRRCISVINLDAPNETEVAADGRYVRVTGIIRSDASDNGTVIRLAACQKAAMEILQVRSL